MRDTRKVDHRDYADPQGPYRNQTRRPGAAMWLIGFIVVFAAIIGIYYSLMRDTQQTASTTSVNTPGAQSSINSPTPQPPSERQAPL